MLPTCVQTVETGSAPSRGPGRVAVYLPAARHRAGSEGSDGGNLQNRILRGEGRERPRRGTEIEDTIQEVSAGM